MDYQIMMLEWQSASVVKCVPERITDDSISSSDHLRSEMSVHLDLSTQQ